MRCLVSYVLCLRARHVFCHFVCVDHRYDNFVVGLTNSNPTSSTPSLFKYEVCDRYPGAVPNGRTVSVHCLDCLPTFRYVIVQLPFYNHLVVCEVEVLVRGMRMSSINILIFTTQADSCSMLLFLLYAEGRYLLDCFLTYSDWNHVVKFNYSLIIHNVFLMCECA